MHGYTSCMGSQTQTNTILLADDMVVLGGQMDQQHEVSTSAYVQVQNTFKSIIRKLESEDCTIQDIVKIVVYYQHDKCDERTLSEQVGNCLKVGCTAVLTLVPVTRVGEDNEWVAIDVIAFRDADPSPVVVAGLAPPGPNLCHGVRCGAFTFVGGQSSQNERWDVLYPSDLVSQNQQTIEHLRIVLDAIGLDEKDIVKANSWRAFPPTHAAYEAAARGRFDFFGPAKPAVTGITVPGLDVLDQLIRIDVWAIDPTLTRHYIQPNDHWGWKTTTPYSHGLKVGPWLFIGGQAALDASCQVTSPRDGRAQMRETMNFVHNVIKGSNLSNPYIGKANAYITRDAEYGNVTTDFVNLIENGTWTSVELNQLAYDHQMVEVEAIVCEKLLPE